MMARVYRVTFATVNPNILGRAASEARLAFTIQNGFGYAENYGMEHTVTMETAETNLHATRRFVDKFIRTTKEDSAYVTIDGASPQLWHRDGTTTALEYPMIRDETAEPWAQQESTPVGEVVALAEALAETDAGTEGVTVQTDGVKVEVYPVRPPQYAGDASRMLTELTEHM